MLTEKQIRTIKVMNTGFTTKYIQEKDAEWNKFVKRIKDSGKDLSIIRLVQEGKEDECEDE